MIQTKRLYFSLLFVFVIFGFQNALAQKSKLQIDYTVRLSDVSKRQFHITTEIKNLDQPKLDLSLPTWTPGWYTVENYGKNILRFTIKDANGKPVFYTRTRKQTWSVDTKNVKSIKIEYDYRAEILGLNQAKIADDMAFFTGIELFLEPVGHRSAPSKLHFQIPNDWKLVSALKETSDPMTFEAADYDTLVDAPAKMGKLDVEKFQIDGKPHTFAAYPSGTFSKQKTDEFIEMLGKIAMTEKAIFGELPYEKYTYFYFFMPAESNAGGALEHLDSFVAFAPPGDVATPGGLIGTAAHEFFHLWNVKRIRPAEMFPYDYSRENETPLLWVSEGFTNYYASLATYRSGIFTKEQFLKRRAGTIGDIEGSEVRKYISPAEASVSTWLGYDTPVAFGISYYTQGENLGALLDLSINHDTQGKAGLDDVFRALYKDFYKKGKGFTTDDMLGIIKKITKKDYRDFYRKYVFGTETPNYDDIYGYAGYKIEKKSTQSPSFGLNARFSNGEILVNDVYKDEAADKAGLIKGDVITKINGDKIAVVQFQDLAGKTVKLTVTRDGKEIEIPMTVGSREGTEYVLIETPQATAEQLKVRESWLKK